MAWSCDCHVMVLLQVWGYYITDSVAWSCDCHVMVLLQVWGYYIIDSVAGCMVTLTWAVAEHQRMVMIAERLSARQLILRRISEIVCMYVCMYPSRLGIQLFRALHARANVVSRAPV